MFSKSAIGIAVLVLSVGTAVAKTQPIQVTFATAISAKPGTQVLADIAWSCDGTTCTSVSDPEKATDMRACRSLAEKYGAVKSFKTAAHEFDEAQLGKCNQNAKK